MTSEKSATRYIRPHFRAAVRSARTNVLRIYFSIEGAIKESQRRFLKRESKCLPSPFKGILLMTTPEIVSLS